MQLYDGYARLQQMLSVRCCLWPVEIIFSHFFQELSPTYVPGISSEAFMRSDRRWGLVKGVKQPQPEANNTILSSAEVKNVWSCTSSCGCFCCRRHAPFCIQSVFLFYSMF